MCYKSQRKKYITYRLKNHMFDIKGVKVMKVIWNLSTFFLHVKSKIEVIKKYKVNRYNIHNHNWFTTLQNLLYKFFKQIFNVIFPKDSPPKASNTKNKICNGHLFTKSSTEKALTIFFKISFWYFKYTLKGYSTKNNTQNNTLVEFYLPSKFRRHQNLVLRYLEVKLFNQNLEIEISVSIHVVN